MIEGKHSIFLGKTLNYVGFSLHNFRENTQKGDIEIVLKWVRIQ